MRITIIVASILVAVALGYLGVSWLSKPPAVAGRPGADMDVMFVCRETGTLTAGPRQATPAVNPKTGRATLVQALYCPQCGRWQAAPPAELRDRFPTGPVCPVHRAALSETGPANAPLADGRKSGTK